MSLAMRIIKVVAYSCLCSAISLSMVGAQTGQKPSGYELRRLPQSVSAQIKRSIDPQPYLSRITSLEDAQRMQRVYHAGTSFELPHFLFVIDRHNKNAIYYINSRRYELHKDFIHAQKWMRIDSSAQELEQYQSADRRFILGTLSWQPTLKTWTYEFWEGDTITPELIVLADQVLQESFYTPLTFKVNSTAQTLNALEAQKLVPSIRMVEQAQIIQQQPFIPMNIGRAHGRIRLVTNLEKMTDIKPHDILVLQEVPLSIPPVAGVVSNRPSTTLSHVNVLARSWRIPNAYIEQAEKEFAPMDGQWVYFEVTSKGYHIRPAEVLVSSDKKPVLRIASPSIQQKNILPLAQLSSADQKHCGSKASTLGQVMKAMTPSSKIGATVPDGFCVPFAAYVEFMQQPQVQQMIQRTLATANFQEDRSVRKQALAQLQSQLVELPMSAVWLEKILHQWSTQLGQVGVFARSSSNAEDLPKFSGAGLFTSVPNVTTPESLEKAVKTVWASVFNLEAFESREIAGIPLDKIAMGVFVQKAIQAESAGVMVTVDPFDPKRYSATYISAKKGLGIRVVEGEKQAEQVIYVRWSDAIQVLSRSQETTALRINQDGGVTEVEIEPERIVLTDTLVRRLAEMGSMVERQLGGKPQDIEWATDAKGNIYLLQARPFWIP